jgi:hypothetical protein
MVEAEQGPESAEAKLVDAFFEALMDGHELAAASALRQLHTLDGFPAVTKCVACLLAWPDLQAGVFDRRIELRRRTKGRPKKAQDGSVVVQLGLGEATTFFGFIAAGQRREAGMALDQLHGLFGIQVKLLADLFDNNPALPDVFGWRFKLVASGPGMPRNQLRHAASDFGWRRVLCEAIAKYPQKKEAAIQDVMTRTDRPRSTVIDMMNRLDIPGSKK